MNEEESKEEREDKDEEAAEKKIPEEKEFPPEFEYTRKQTGIRILATLFFGIVVLGIMGAIILLVVIFQIIYALIMEKTNARLKGFVNHVISYFYKVMRYLTFNEDRVPFPFSRFPEEIENPELK